MSWPLIGQFPPVLACDWLRAARPADGALSVTGQQSRGGDIAPVMTEVKPNISEKTPDIQMDFPSDELLILSNLYLLCLILSLEATLFCYK